MPACVLKRLASDFRRVCAIMVHLAFNGTERRKMPFPLKIGLYVRYHSETPCKVCRKQSSRAQSPYILHSIMQPCGLVKRDPAQYARTCQAVCNPACYTPERSRQTGAAFHGQPAPDFSQLSSQGSAAGSHLPYCHARKCFLRFFCADFCELHQMLIWCSLKH